MLLTFLLTCKSSQRENSKEITITSDEVREMVSYLASDDLKGRDTGSKEIDAAAAYIEKQFKDFGIKTYFETYRDHFQFTNTKPNDVSEINQEVKAFNIVGFLEGNEAALKNEVVILGAHYDHIGEAKPVDGDSIANGANDNAAGTSAVLSLAKYFSAKKSNKRSLMFVLFSAEEKGLLGSKHLSSLLREKGDFDLYTMVNFEMIGVPMKDRDYMAYLSGYKLSNMGDKINEYTKTNLVGLLPKARALNLFKRSDNYPFHQAFSVACQTLSTFDFTNYNYYHHVDDEPQHMDFDFMANVINQIIPAIERMTTTPEKEIYMYGE